MIRILTGDYWSLAANVRVNTVNCQGIMGKGIAKEFRDRYPDMYRAYSQLCNAGKIKPGNIHVYDHPDGTQVWNAATKDHWRDPSRYEWVDNILLTMQRKLQPLAGPLYVLVPALGCSNGGLDWDQVSKMIINRLYETKHNIFVFNPPGYDYNVQIP